MTGEERQQCLQAAAAAVKQTATGATPQRQGACVDEGNAFIDPDPTQQEQPQTPQQQQMRRPTHVEIGSAPATPRSRSKRESEGAQSPSKVSRAGTPRRPASSMTTTSEEPSNAQLMNMLQQSQQIAGTPNCLRLDHVRLPCLRIRLMLTALLELCCDLVQLLARQTEVSTGRWRAVGL